jgi:hypothetical protein
VSKKKNKFDLTHLVHDGVIKNGETLFFVSDPGKICVVTMQPNHEYKVMVGKEVTTLHAYAQQLLGQEPPDHAAKWFRTAKNKTLFEIWHENDMADAA